jgi:CMP-N,N'-diacetyllegionaminic acid synthase
MGQQRGAQVILGGRVLAVIPGRGGSKGVPRKNLREVGGRPLIGWAWDAARGAPSLDRVILSSEDPAIIEVGHRLGMEAPYVRDVALAGDTTPTIDVLLDALDRLPGYEWVVLLQPTSPLRTAADIEGCIARCLETGAPACVSVTRARENPYWMCTLTADGRLQPLLAHALITRRQDLPAAYRLNGAVYVARAGFLRERRNFLQPETVAYEMPVERSLDIDTEADFLQLQTILGK